MEIPFFDEKGITLKVIQNREDSLERINLNSNLKSLSILRYATINEKPTLQTFLQNTVDKLNLMQLFGTNVLYSMISIFKVYYTENYQKLVIVWGFNQDSATPFEEPTTNWDMVQYFEENTSLKNLILDQKLASQTIAQVIWEINYKLIATNKTLRNVFSITSEILKNIENICVNNVSLNKHGNVSVELTAYENM